MTVEGKQSIYIYYDSWSFVFNISYKEKHVYTHIIHIWKYQVEMSIIVIRRNFVLIHIQIFMIIEKL